MKTLILINCGTPVGTYPEDQIAQERVKFEHYHGHIFKERDAFPHEIAKEVEKRAWAQLSIFQLGN
ncbi:MAG: hypothetical protein JO370_16740 [Paucibacter sp.]|nr:hypothetical protein [Roseateles sp.]